MFVSSNVHGRPKLPTKHII